MRVLELVEQHEQRRMTFLLGRAQDGVELLIGDRRRLREHALMARALRGALDLFALNELHGDAARPRKLQDRRNLCLAAALREEDPVDAAPRP